MSSTSTPNIKNKSITKNEQIPTEYNEDETLRVLRKQNKVPGEARSKIVNDFPKTAAMGQILKDLEFPVDKSTILRFIQNSNNPQAKDNEIMSIIEKIEDKQYKNAADVAEATQLVQK
jgi:hypothetical protein